MTEIQCVDHQEINLLYCVFDLSTNLFTVRQYTFCNNCGVKMCESLLYNQMTTIPEIKDKKITKVICNVKSNGYEYEWFGHKEDRQFFVDNGDKWI